MRKLYLLVLAVTSSLNLGSVVVGQVSSGTPSWSAYDPHQLDTVNLLNNNIVLNIPIRSKSGAFPFEYRATGNYYMANVSGTWASGANIIATQFQGSANEFIDILTGSSFTVTSTVNCPGSGTTTKYSNWVVYSGNGTSHPLPTTVYTDKTAAGTSCLSGSGFSVVTTDNSGITVTAASNGIVASSIYSSGGMSLNTDQITDSNGNSIYLSGANFYDTLGIPVLTYGGLLTGPWSWSDVNGGSQQVSVTTATQTIQSNFGCASVKDFGPITGFVAPTTLSFPDGTSIGLAYEQTPGHTSNYTGRISELTLREGGTITYTYGGSNNGIDCTYQNVPKLTRQTSDGTTTYTLTHNLIPGGGGSYNAVNTVLDQGGNQTVYTFVGFSATGAVSGNSAPALIEVQKYQGTSTLLTTDVYCYNAAFSNCSPTPVAGAPPLPVTEVVVFHQISGMTTWAATDTQYDNYGNVTYLALYDFGATSPTVATTTRYGTWNGTTCVAVSTTVNNKPCDVIKQAVSTNNSPTIAESRYVYGRCPARS